jgi:hypothetical protein
LNVTTIWIALAICYLALTGAAALTPKQTSIQGGHYSLGVYRTNLDGLAAFVEQHMDSSRTIVFSANGSNNLAIPITFHPVIVPDGNLDSVGHLPRALFNA